MARKRKGITKKRGLARVELSFEGLGKILNSEKMNTVIKNKADEIAAGIGGNVEVRQPDKRVNHNRVRYFVVYTHSNPREKNEKLSEALKRRGK